MSINLTRSGSNETTDADRAVVIRAARPDDRAALRGLADLDSAPLPAEPIVVAEVGDEIRAAVSVADGRAIADPFHRSTELAALAEMRASQLRGATRRRMRIVARTPDTPEAGARPVATAA